MFKRRDGQGAGGDGSYPGGDGSYPGGDGPAAGGPSEGGRGAGGRGGGSAADGDRLANYMTMVGHLCSDINQGALSATLPFLVIHSGYSYAACTMLVLAANGASAVIQPLFGWIGDRRPCPWFMALGVFLAGLGMFGVGFAGSYPSVVLSAMVTGVGVAMFHPEGGRLANLAAGERKGSGMSIFAVGGNIGFFVGPILAATFLTAFGLHGTWVFLVPATLCAIVLLSMNGRFAALGAMGPGGAGGPEAREHWGKFGLVMGVLSMRSIVQYGLLAFIPLFLLDVLGQGEALSSLAVSFFSIAAAASTAVSGRVSARVGVHRLLAVCLVATAVLAALFAFNRSVAAAFALAMLLAVAIDLFYPSTVALGMSYVPRHLGTASGFSYGVAVCAGGVASPFLGIAGDVFGLPTALLAIAAAAAVGAALAMVLRRVDGR